MGVHVAAKGSRISQIANWFTSRKHFRGVIECPASLTQLGQGNVSKKLFVPKSSSENNEDISGILRKLRIESQSVSNGLTERWVNIAKELSLFGIQQPREYGGLGLDNLRTACVFEELCFNIPLAILLMSHNYWVLEPFATCEDESRLRKLSSGETIGALACTEQGSGTDFQAQESIILDKAFSGRKHWVTGADIASLFLASGYDSDSFKLVIMEQTSTCQLLNVIASDGLKFCDVVFDKAPISRILDCKDAYGSLVSLMLNGRKYVTAVCSGLAKHVLNEIISFLRLDQSNLADRTTRENERIWLKASSLALSCESLAFYVCAVDWDSDGIEVALASCRAIDICRELVHILTEMLDMRIALVNESALPMLSSQLELLSHFGWSEMVIRLYAGSEIMRQLGKDKAEFKELLNEYTGVGARIYLSSERDCLLRGQPVFLYDIWEHSKAPWVNSHKTETSLVQIRSMCYYLMLRDRVGVLDEAGENQQSDLIRLAQLGEHVLTLLALQARLHIGERQQTTEILNYLADRSMEHELAEASRLYREVCGREFPQSEIASRIGRQLLTEGRYHLSNPIKRLF